MAKRTTTPKITDPAQASREAARAKNAAARAQRNRLAAADLELRRAELAAREREREERQKRIAEAREAGGIELEEAIGLLAALARAADVDSTRVSAIQTLAKLKGWGADSGTRVDLSALATASDEELISVLNRGLGA